MADGRARATVAVLRALLLLAAGWTVVVGVATHAPDPSTGSTRTIGTVGVPAGLSSFGQSFPRGMVRSGVRVGGEVTQVDVKRRWPDGSIKHAVISVRSRTAGRFPLHPARSARGIAPASNGQRAIVKFTTGSTSWTASVNGRTPGKDRWLHGPVVREWRETIAPRDASGHTHPSVRVVFDMRTWRGGSRADMTLENVLDVPGAGALTYDSIELRYGNRVIVKRSHLRHPYLTRWRTVATTGEPMGRGDPDLSLTHRSGGVPRYLKLVEQTVDRASGAAYGPFRAGSLDPYMPSHGGRPELAPYPDWTARYLAHGRGAQRIFVLRHGDLSGSWPIHIRQANGNFVSLDESPDFWLDVVEGRGNRSELQPSGPVGNVNANNTGPLVPDNAHQPSLALVPWIVTGERYYADELEAWGHFILLSTWQGESNERSGASGLLTTNEPRGVAWGLRTLADAAAWLPDANSAAGHFARRVRTNLAWLDTFANSSGDNPLGALYHEVSFDEAETVAADGSRRYSMPRPWQNNYIAWAIDRANTLGFSGGSAFRDRVVALQTALFTDSAVPRDNAAPYYLQVGRISSGGQVEWFQSIGQAWPATVTAMHERGEELAPLQGWYGVDARLVLMIGKRLGYSGTPDAYDYVWNAIAVQPFIDGVPDLSRRAGWAIAAPGER